MPRVSVGTSRRVVDRRPRQERAEAALVAAGIDVSVGYQLTHGEPTDLFFQAAALGRGYSAMWRRSWPSEADSLSDDIGEPAFREGNTAVYLEDDRVVIFGVGGGWAYVRVAAASLERAQATVATFEALYPATFLEATDERVPVTFWMNTPHGPTRRLRMIDASPWATVERNYPPSISDELEALMLRFEPGKGGQLLLWQGPPGTGKTWALRALVSEWLPWAEFHYITDPDSFFVEDPSYMVDVLLADTYEAYTPAGDVATEADPEGKWRILILEDTGELLSVNAKQKYGQGLSRLLNVVDGMIGQGLRVLVLVTTNDELGELTPAVRRPGRCASALVFPEFTADEASEWLGFQVETGGTVAELYARRGADAEEPLGVDVEEELVAGAWVRIRPNTGGYLADEADLALSAAANVPAARENSAGEDVRAAIARVAAAHQDDAVGYGETAWNEAERAVLYVCGDWTDPDPIAADFLAIDGVDAFVHEAEALPEGWWEAEVVYPESPPKWVTTRPEEREAALRRVLEIASEPFSV